MIKKLTKGQMLYEIRMNKKIAMSLKKPKADHRHNWKNGKKIRIYGSLHHIHCAVNGCDEFKAVGG